MLACQQARAKRKAFEMGQTAVPRVFQVGHENHTHTHSGTVKKKECEFKF